MKIVDDLAIVLSGGSYKVMFQIFILMVLEWLGIYPKIIYAISGGTPNALGYMTGKAWKLPQIWMGVDPKKLYRRASFWRLLKPMLKGRKPVFGASAILRSEYLAKIIDEEVDFEEVCSLHQKIELRVGIMDLRSGEIQWRSNKEPGMTPARFRQIVLASMRIVVLYEPVEDEGGCRQMVDAGFETNLPLAKAIKDGFSKIIAVSALPRQLIPTTLPLENLVEFDLRHADIAHSRELRRQLKLIDAINKNPDAKKKIELCLIAAPPQLRIFQKTKEFGYGSPTPEAKLELLGAGYEATFYLGKFLYRQGLISHLPKTANSPR